MKALVIGGSNGMGLAIVRKLSARSVNIELEEAGTKTGFSMCLPHHLKVPDPMVAKTN